MSQTFNQWLRSWGYKWAEDEHMVKGFMTEAEAKAVLADYESQGAVIRG